MKKYINLANIVLCAFGLSACSGNGECIDAPLTNTIPDITTSQSALTAVELVGDEAADRAYQQIDKILASNSELRMNIYALESPSSIEELIENRHFISPVVEENEKRITVKDGNTVCSWHKHSFYEECADESIFNINAGVPRKAIYSDGFYISTAQNILNKTIEPKTTVHYDFVPYKRKYGINGTVSIDNPKDVTETVFEAAVGFSSELDGWPVIGPGGKIYIHMLPDGQVAAHRAYRKIPGKAVASLTQNDIKTPDEALKEVINNEKIDMNSYHVVRHDFGYFYRGKNSIQNVIAPHYVFFFAPTDSMFDTQIYHIVSAVKGDASKIVDEDYRLELNRKADNLKNVEPAQENK